MPKQGNEMTSRVRLGLKVGFLHEKKIKTKTSMFCLTFITVLFANIVEESTRITFNLHLAFAC